MLKYVLTRDQWDISQHLAIRRGGINLASAMLTKTTPVMLNQHPLQHAHIDRVQQLACTLSCLLHAMPCTSSCCKADPASKFSLSLRSPRTCTKDRDKHIPTHYRFVRNRLR